MIILPDRNICHTKFLVPVNMKEWRDPSLTQKKDELGNSIFRTRFRIRARLNDGFVKWIGWFDSRDDFDAFLWAIVNNTLIYEKELWKLPTPQWHPDIGPDLSYDFATQRLITSTSASNQTDTVPSDWNSASNTIETIGGGASGGAAGTSSGYTCATGGGGGAYSLISNLTLTKGGSATFFLNVGGAAVTSVNSGGNLGPNTWYNGTTVSNASVSAYGGSAGNKQIGSINTTLAGSAGGTTSGVGTTKYSGGSSGSTVVTGPFSSASGGGGSAGPSGNGGNSSNGSSSNTNGGSSNNGTTAGGTAPGGNGSSGTEFTTAGCGSGGAGGNLTGGSGANYGGGGGGSALTTSSTPTSGAGKQGIIVATYTPPAKFGFNMPMLGM